MPSKPAKQWKLERKNEIVIIKGLLIASDLR